MTICRCLQPVALVAGGRWYDLPKISRVLRPITKGGKRLSNCLHLADAEDIWHMRTLECTGRPEVGACPTRVPGRERAVPTGHEHAERVLPTYVVTNFLRQLTNFRRSVLICIEASDCESRLILQHFSKSTRCACLCTAKPPDFLQIFVDLSRFFGAKFAIHRCKTDCLTNFFTKC